MKFENKVFVSCALGATIAWYDFIIFAAATALIFPKLFFPGMGFIIPILVFSVGLAARPLGSLIFGHFGDKFGRKNTLIATLYITGLSTVMIGLLPTYSDVGIYAPALLIFARIVQAFAFGGEVAAASTMLMEYNIKSPRRGLITSVVSSGWAIASILSALMFMIVTSFGDAFFSTWGWRIPFLCSALLMFVGIYIRLRILETPVFDQNKIDNRLHTLPIRTLISNYWKKMLLGAGAFQLSAAWAYGVSLFGFGYAINKELISRGSLSEMQFYITPILLAALIFFGWLGDKISRVRLFQLGAVMSLFFVYPVFTWIQQGNLVWAMLALCLIQIPAFASAPGFFAEIYPSSVRQTGVGVTFNLGTIIGAGIVPIIAQRILDVTGDITSVALLFMVLTVVGLISSFWLARDKNLIVSDQ